MLWETPKWDHMVLQSGHVWPRCQEVCNSSIEVTFIHYRKLEVQAKCWQCGDWIPRCISGHTSVMFSPMQRWNHNETLYTQLQPKCEIWPGFRHHFCAPCIKHFAMHVNCHAKNLSQSPHWNSWQQVSKVSNFPKHLALGLRSFPGFDRVCTHAQTWGRGSSSALTSSRFGFRETFCIPATRVSEDHTLLRSCSILA